MGVPRKVGTSSVSWGAVIPGIMQGYAGWNGWKILDVISPSLLEDYERCRSNI